VSTDLQAFALIVTAEPYSSVRSPGDVVVLENQVRPDTLGMIEEVNARYELLPRGQYTLNLSDSRPPDSARVSTREYEVLLELYQAQNAINIARTAHADRLAPEVFSKAEALLNEARTRHEHKGDRTTILQQARQATQTAEDARLIAVERSQRESVIALKAEALANRQAQANAEAEAARARVERQALEEQLHRTQAELQAARANAQAEAERAARLPTEADRVGQQPPPPQQQQQQPPPPKARQADQRAYRLRVFESLNAVMPALDTPRGLVVVISDGMFKGSRLQPEVVDRARRLAAALASYQGLRIIVEGHSASAATEREAAARAGHVAELLRSRGLQASARSMGNRRPAGPGRVENNRIEIVVWGEAIGTVASWDRPYSLSLR
jgi:flagellar motor protein MotB